MKNKTVDILMCGNEKVVDLDEPYTVYNADLIPDEEVKTIYTASMEDIQKGIDLFEMDGRITAVVKLIDLVFNNMSKIETKWQNLVICSLSQEKELMLDRMDLPFWIKRE